jgi:hypothetical protein
LIGEKRRKNAAYIKNIDSALVHEEALKQTLDDDEALAEHQDGRREHSAAAVEDGEKQQLRQEREGKEEEIHQERDDG